jgi:hypothetical protein
MPISRTLQGISTYQAIIPLDRADPFSTAQIHAVSHDEEEGGECGHLGHHRLIDFVSTPSALIGSVKKLVPSAFVWRDYRPANCVYVPPWVVYAMQIAVYATFANTKP